MSKFYNLTPHIITLRLSGGTDLNIEPEKIPARLDTKTSGLQEWGLPVLVQTNKVIGLSGLPGPEQDVWYIVSMPTAQAVNRPDLLSPGTGPNDGCLRNDAGQVIAVTRLISWYQSE